MTTMISVRNIEKSFGTLSVLKGLSLEVSENEIVSIVGASGAGKTTLLHIIGTLEKPDSGQVFYEENDVFKMGDRQLSAFRNLQIGFVFQFHHLLPEFTALENTMLPALIAGKSKREAEESALQLLSFLGVDSRKTHKPSQMSGGEQQRVAVARALVNNPKVLLADEPSGNLDSKNANDLHELFLKLRKELGQTFVIITHNQDLASIADRKLEMKDGNFI
jgi:lipoprotein-releasing system ATP-binding protein